MLKYTGIGHRDTPERILVLLREIGAFLASNNCILRSGGAQGADKAFEDGCNRAGGKKEIYLPCKGFNGNNSRLYRIAEDDAALAFAAKYHPHWESLKQNVKLLVGRNVYQILGQDLKTASDFVICYSVRPSGMNVALLISKKHNIDIYNLGDEKTWPAEKRREIFDVLAEKYQIGKGTK